MKLIFIFLLSSIFSIKQSIDFENVLTDLENLEKYIKLYLKETSITEYSLTHLIVCYIRLGAYKTTEWNIAGGSLPENLTDYIEAKDKEYGTSAQTTQTYRDIEMPNKEINDFVHMFAVMNGIEYGNSYSSGFAHLVGWGGDTEQLLEDIMKQSGDLDSLMEIAKSTYFRIKGGFDEPDLVADLDGAILLSKKNDNNNFADLIREYYTTDQYKDRVTEFIKLTFPNLKNKENFREEIFNIYSNDFYIKVLECKAGLRNPGSFMGCYLPSDILEQYSDHQKAAVYVVSDYFSENFIPSSESDVIPESDQTKSDDEITDHQESDDKNTDGTDTDKVETDNKGTDGNNSKRNNFQYFYLLMLVLLI